MIGVPNSSELRMQDIPAFGSDEIPREATLTGMAYDDTSRQNWDMYKMPGGNTLRALAAISAPVEIRLKEGKI